MEKKIKIDIETKLPTISWKELKTFEFNSLKETEGRDVSKLKNSIVNRGFKFPFYVWNRFVIDGTGRELALLELEQEGWEIPDLPYVAVKASSLEEAKILTLAASSQHGQVTQQSLELFAGNLELPLEEISLPGLDLTLEGFTGITEEGEEEETGEEKYSQKVNIPIYEPSGNKPELKELFNNEKTNELEKIIKKANLSKDQKDFLFLAAQRFLEFDYSKIANYYAHSETEMQGLMEKLALVIIDFDQAIENGFVKLTNRILELQKDSKKDEEDD